MTALAAACAAISACSSIVDGTSQEIAVATESSAAVCSFKCQGLEIANVASTPGVATVQKTKYDITITCTKDGFHDQIYFNKSGVAAATFGNIIAGGGIGWAIDSASGVDNKYTSPVQVTLTPLSEPDPDPQYSPEETDLKDEEEDVGEAGSPTS